MPEKLVHGLQALLAGGTAGHDDASPVSYTVVVSNCRNLPSPADSVHSPLRRKPEFLFLMPYFGVSYNPKKSPGREDTPCTCGRPSTFPPSPRQIRLNYLAEFMRLSPQSSKDCLPPSSTAARKSKLSRRP